MNNLTRSQSLFGLDSDNLTIAGNSAPQSMSRLVTEQQPTTLIYYIFRFESQPQLEQGVSNDIMKDYFDNK